MPFVAEDVWSRLPGKRGFVMSASWPDDLHTYIDGQAELEFESLMATVYELRSYRKTVPGAPQNRGAVKLVDSPGPHWERALALLAHVVVTDSLPPANQLPLAARHVAFPAATRAD